MVALQILMNVNHKAEAARLNEQKQTLWTIRLQVNIICVDGVVVRVRMSSGA